MEGEMIKTVSQLFINTVKSYPKDDIMMYKEEGKYKSISTKEFEDRVKHFSLGLKDLGLKAGNKLVIFSENRPEWVMTDLSVLCAGGITVPIYTSLVSDPIKYIIEDSDAKIVVCSDSELWKKIDPIKKDLKNISHYISFESETPEGVLSYEEVLEKGKKINQDNPDLFEKMAMDVKPEDTASIIYTSGTTGEPKGVILSHANFLSNVTTVTEIIEFSKKDTVLSFLPLSHVLERMVTLCYFYKGCSVAYVESLDTLIENLAEVCPHIMVSVPRIFERIYAGVMDNVLAGSGVKRKIFFWAIKVGKECSKRKFLNQEIPGGLRFKKNLAHKLVFSKIIAKTGGRVRFFVSGGAALSKDIAEFFDAMGLTILEGYGLTETSPVIAVNTFENQRLGSVGKPIPGVDVKIEDDGEILTKGPNVMKGYYKKEAGTKEVFEGEWFRTGDIGHLDEEGFLYITDRKKDLIVTAGGKNVAPQPIEILIKTNPYIVNAVVVGDGRKFISALVVPDLVKLAEYAKAQNISFDKPEDLIKNDKVNDFVLSEIENFTPSLASFEKIKKIILLEKDFEIEKGEMTPSIKVKRNIVEEKYKDQIDSLYTD
jgi:long-chain acyl-CoA synthetase